MGPCSATTRAPLGIQIDPEALALYRLWFDLAEISEYLTLFRAPHGETADAAEALGKPPALPASGRTVACPVQPRPRSTRAKKLPPRAAARARVKPARPAHGISMPAGRSRSRRNE